jgi:hypothetical protein
MSWLYAYAWAQTWPLSDTYIYLASPVHRSSHNINVYTLSRTLCPHQLILWQYIVSNLTPPVGLCFYHSKLRSKATTLLWVGFLPSFQVNADPVKPLSNPFEFLSQSLLSLSLSFSIRLSFQAGCRETPCELWFLFSASKSPYLAMLLLHVLSLQAGYRETLCGLYSLFLITV